MLPGTCSLRTFTLLATEFFVIAIRAVCMRTLIELLDLFQMIWCRIGRTTKDKNLTVCKLSCKLTAETHQSRASVRTFSAYRRNRIGKLAPAKVSLGKRMKLPEHEWVQFKRAPLKLVIGQVRFTIMPRFEQKAFIAGFKDAMHAVYPRVSRDQAVTYQLSPAGINPGTGEILWRFSSRDNKWAVVVGEAAITLESRGYSSMRDFLERFTAILEAAKETLEVNDRLRLGLRYINEIRHPDAESLTDWRKLLNPEFVGFDASSLLGGQVDHSLQEVQVERPDGTLAIRHGLLNGAVVAPQEQPASGPFYLIDLDYYDTTECDLDIPATIKQMQDYNDIMYRFFCWTLGEKLYSYLEPIHDQRS
jgi:uncharacterized protein (TIGR04255 family)